MVLPGTTAACIPLAAHSKVNIGLKLANAGWAERELYDLMLNAIKSNQLISPWFQYYQYSILIFHSIEIGVKLANAGRAIKSTDISLFPYNQYSIIWNPYSTVLILVSNLAMLEKQRESYMLWCWLQSNQIKWYQSAMHNKHQKGCPREHVCKSVCNSVTHFLS